MATRSLIGMEFDDGSVQVIYCHWDGYPEYVGVQLEHNYDNEDTVTKLLELGDRSTLGGVADYENTYVNLKGEALNKSAWNSMQEFYEADKAGAEFAYIWKRNFGWTVYKVWADGDLENLGRITGIKVEFTKSE